jgi:positive phototaxis protein PixI
MSSKPSLIKPPWVDSLQPALTLHRPNPTSLVGDGYLRVQLLPDVDALLPMLQVQEVVSLPASRLAPMPNMPPCILGLMNRRSQVLWVVNLVQLLGLPSLPQTQRDYSLVVIRSAGLTLALVVQQIKNHSWIAPESIQPVPEQLSPRLQPYLRGCLLEETALALVLDADAIANSAALHQQH